MLEHQRSQDHLQAATQVLAKLLRLSEPLFYLHDVQ